MPSPLKPYDYYVFDCDGVILNSNTVKSEAFYKTLERFGDSLAREFVAYHQRHGGISRNEKFAYFITHMLGEDLQQQQPLLAQLLQDYGIICQRDLLSCELIPGIEAFLQNTVKDKPAFVVTGGKQSEVRAIFKQRGLSDYFQLILGSPTSKRENMETFQRQGCFLGEGIYFGDARLDKELADDFGQDFIYISGVSEWAEGSNECSDCMAEDFSALQAP